MYTIGINENFYLNEVKILPEGDCELSFIQKSVGTKKASDIISGKESMAKTTFRQKYFCPSTTIAGQAVPPIDVFNSLNGFRATLNELLEIYLPEDKIKWEGLDEGTGLEITDETTEAELLEQIDLVFNKDSNIRTYFKNIITAFGSMIEENDVDFKGIGLRVKLINKKNYYKLPNYGFVEAMTIPAELTKLKFTQYEIDNGMDKPTAPKDLTPEASAEQTAAINTVFQDVV